jgi:hypothetical protein
MGAKGSRTQDIKGFQWESCRQYASLKRRWVSTGLHSVTSQTMVLFTATTARTSNSAYVILIYYCFALSYLKFTTISNYLLSVLILSFCLPFWWQFKGDVNEILGDCATWKWATLPALRHNILPVFLQTKSLEKETSSINRAQLSGFLLLPADGEGVSALLNKKRRWTMSNICVSLVTYYRHKHSDKLFYYCENFLLFRP